MPLYSVESSQLAALSNPIKKTNALHFAYNANLLGVLAPFPSTVFNPHLWA
jgi:hypothetical protein